MEKEFLPYEQALALKELGFDEPCFGRYIYDGRGKEWFLVQTQQTKSASVIFEGARSVDGISVAAPLYQQAFRWFREKYNLQCWVETTGSKRYSCRYDGNDDTGKRWVGYLRDDLGNILFYNTYEEAELACLKKLIEIVKK
jgi:hypothetical protein